jgi:serine/threonine protein kinase
LKALLHRNHQPPTKAVTNSMASPARRDKCETEHYFVGANIDDRYELTEFIGAGGMACVYRAQEQGSPHEYAIKFLKAEYHNMPYLIEYFRDEASSMRDLAHPNIVRFYRFVNRDEYSYIIMDYVDGFALSDVLKLTAKQKQAMPLDEIVRVMTQIARALDAIHREGFVHRDIKPSNVLIDRKSGRAFLTDLGITSATNTRMEGAGTMAYMSPEQAETWVADQRSDIYSYGIMLFEMLAMERPFRVAAGLSGSEAEADLLRKHKETPVPDVTEYRRDLPKELNAILAKAMAKKPQERYQSILDFAHDVHEVLKSRLSEDLQDFTKIQHRQIAAPTAGAVDNAAQPMFRAMMGVGVVAILAAAALAIGVITGAIGGEPPPTATLTQVPSETPAPSLTPSPNPLIGEEVFTLIAGLDALAEPSVSDSLTILPAEDGGLNYLRVGMVDGFSVSLTVASTEGVESFGVAYRVQDASNYQLFTVKPSSGDWQFVAVVGGESTVEQSGTVSSVPDELIVSGRGDYAQVRLGDTRLENVSGLFETGSLALYVDAGVLQLESLTISLIGPEARQAAELAPTPAEGLGDLSRFLVADVNALLDTNDLINSEIDCPPYIEVYEGLERHLTSRSADVRRLAQETIDAGELIYERCRSESPDAPLSFVFSTQDYLEWEENLRAIQEELEG